MKNQEAAKTKPYFSAAYYGNGKQEASVRKLLSNTIENVGNQFQQVHKYFAPNTTYDLLRRQTQRFAILFGFIFFEYAISADFQFRISRTVGAYTVSVGQTIIPYD